MGVKNLWQILSSTAERMDLREVRGSVVAVDLSGWIVENAKVTPGIVKPYLRNLFFRCAALTSLGILPVFVADARKAPAIKSSALILRRGDDNHTSTSERKPVNLDRRRLMSLINECKTMIEALGLPFVESPGEAEGYCVHMNLNAVVSEDSDVFCYGSNFCVWRNFSITGGKFFTVEKYETHKIESLLGLSRDRMLMLAVMLGCDYFPTGVPGVGKESILNLFNSWDKEWNALDILDHWIESNFDTSPTDSICYSPCSSENRCCSDCYNTPGTCRCEHLRKCPELTKLESSIKKKCQKIDSSFWISSYPEIKREFKSFSATGHDPYSFKWKPPDLCKLVSLLVTKLSWTESYSFQKIFPILTRWQISSTTNEAILSLSELIRKRSVDGIPSLEVRWTFVNDNLNDCFKNDDFVTIEPIELLIRFNSDMVSDFLKTVEKKSKKTKKMKSTTSRFSKVEDANGTDQDPSAKAVKVCENKENLRTELKEYQGQITQFYKRVDTNKIQSPAKDIDDADSSYSIQNSDTQHKVDSICDQLEDCSLNDTVEDNDLSFIIDEIVSKSSSDKKESLLTSTPTLRQTACLNAKRLNELSDKGLKDPYCKEGMEEKEQSNSSMEDSFDRMCIPSGWIK